MTMEAVSTSQPQKTFHLKKKSNDATQLNNNYTPFNFFEVLFFDLKYVNFSKVILRY